MAASPQVPASERVRRILQDYLGEMLVDGILGAFERAVRSATAEPSPYTHGVRDGLWKALQAVCLSDADIGGLEHEIILSIRKPRSHKKAKQAELPEEETS